MDFVLPVPPRSYTQLNSPARHCPSQVIHWQHKALLTDLRSIIRGFIPKFRINLQNPPCSTTLTYDSVSNDSSVLLYDSRRLVGTIRKWQGACYHHKKTSQIFCRTPCAVSADQYGPQNLFCMWYSPYISNTG